MAGRLSRDFVAAIGDLLADTRDSASHLTALYVLGHVTEPPGVATIVSSGRRRHRDGDGFSVQFVYHPRTTPRDVQTVVIGGTPVATATVEQALVDLVTDWRYAPPLSEVGALFARLPYDRRRLVALAGETADVALKRTLFWLFWSGRGGSDEAALRLSRTPAKLTPDADQQDCAWFGRLSLRYPRAVLGFDLPEGPADLAAEVRDWMELRRCEAFRSFMTRHAWLPLVGDCTSTAGGVLREFFRETLTRWLRDDPGQLLDALVPRRFTVDSPAELPRLFLRWCRDEAAGEIAADARTIAWTRHHLAANDPRQLETAMYWALRVGLQYEALTRLADAGRLLFQSNHCLAVVPLYQWARRQRRLVVPFGAAIACARVLAQEGRCDEALEVVETARAQTASEDAAALGDLAFAAAIALRHARRFDGAVAELAAARGHFAACGARSRLYAVETAVGNVEYARGNLREARRSYAAAMALDDVRAERSRLANVLTNLGLVEFKAGRFQRATRYLSQALRIHGEMGNALGESTSLMTLGKVRLATGDATRALKLFRDALTTQQQLGDAVSRAETHALIAWTLELLGQGGAAQVEWARIPAVTDALPAGSAFLVRFYRALRALLRGDFAAARGEFAELARLGVEQAFPADEIALVRFYGALARAHDEAKPPVAELRAVLATVADLGDHCLRLQMQCCAWLMAPEAFSAIEPERAISALLVTRYHDPLWFLLARDLEHHDLPAARSLLRRFWLKTPADLRLVLAERFVWLRRLFRILKRRVATPAALMHWKNGTVQRIARDQYDVWQQTLSGPGFRFDGVAGRLSFAQRSAHLRPGSYPHRLFSQLLLASAEPIPLPDLYRSVWGTEYDPETDWPALKAALVRLRRRLARVTSALRLELRPGRPGPGRLQLLVSCPWEAVL